MTKLIRLNFSCYLHLHGTGSSTVNTYYRFRNLLSADKRRPLFPAIQQCIIQDGHCKSFLCLSPIEYKGFLFISPTKQCPVQTKAFHNGFSARLMKIRSLQMSTTMERKQLFLINDGAQYDLVMFSIYRDPIKSS